MREGENMSKTKEQYEEKEGGGDEEERCTRGSEGRCERDYRERETRKKRRERRR
jgi:hypothetical protein